MRDWLQLFRAQTAPATVYALTIPCIVAGCVDTIILAYLFIVGHILHWASFGHNSLMDYLLGFDKVDPNKSHHPLVAGRIDPVRASWVIHLMLFGSTILLAIPTIILDRTLALFFLLAYAVWGYAYNNGLDHLSRRSWIPISLAFGFLPLYGYFLYGEDPRIAMLLGLWGFLVTFYQIDFEGNLKDLWNPVDTAANKLSKHCKISGEEYSCDPDTGLEHLAARLLAVAIPVWILFLQGHGLLIQAYAVIVFILSAIGTLVLHNKLVDGGSRRKMLEYMGLQEVLAFYSLLLVFLPTRPVELGLLAIYGVAYFVAMNKILWGSRFGPRV